MVVLSSSAFSPGELDREGETGLTVVPIEFNAEMLFQQMNDQ
jgi:hypothetical protein